MTSSGTRRTRWMRRSTVWLPFSLLVTGPGVPGRHGAGATAALPTSGMPWLPMRPSRSTTSTDGRSVRLKRWEAEADLTFEIRDSHGTRSVASGSPGRSRGSRVSPTNGRSWGGGKGVGRGGGGGRMTDHVTQRPALGAWNLAEIEGRGWCPEGAQRSQQVRRRSHGFGPPVVVRSA